MDSFLQKQSSSQAQTLHTESLSASSTSSMTNDALVFSRGDDGVNVAAFNDAFSLDNTLTKIRNSSNGKTATDNSSAKLLGSLLNTLTTTSKANGFVDMHLQA